MKFLSKHGISIASIIIALVSLYVVLETKQDVKILMDRSPEISQVLFQEQKDIEISIECENTLALDPDADCS